MYKIWEYYVGLSPSIKSTIILTIILLIIVFVIHLKLRKHDETKVPKGLLFISEWLVDMINSFTKNIIGKRWRSLAPYFLYLVIFITVANFSGLLGLTPPTASVSVTLTLGFVTFFLINYMGIKSKGVGGHFKELVSPSPLMLPINLISEIVTPFSLAFRLFGNILSGVIVMLLVYSAFGWVALVISPALHAIFDLAFGLIQTVIFLMLTAMFIAGKIPEEELI